ncbi:MAG: PstS family phosphate ABC transporter substrate-binding protein [Coriobacteriales bacterium]|nr:PstS family phosphate ABC transporter substrate-binding protein [Coriobacteriales bacterium]
MKARKWIALGLTASLLVGGFALTGCNQAQSTGGETTGEQASELSGTISVEGSDTMVNLAQAWQEAFNETNPNVMITVKGGGSGAGIAALINGTVDFADASREIKPEEVDQAKAAGINPVQTEVAKDGIAVIVNKGNAVTGLTTDQLGKIYRGEITNWKDVGGADSEIVLLGRDTSSGTYEFFSEAVVGKDAKYAKSMRNMQSSQAIVDEVAKNAAGIGYVGMGYESPSIKVLEVDGVAATPEGVVSGEYPLSRGLYMYSNGEPADAMKAYLEWILGADGQKVVEEQGFVPLAQ